MTCDTRSHYPVFVDQQKRGAPFYMAPELFQPTGVNSFASDLWALGCVLYVAVPDVCSTSVRWVICPLMRCVTVAQI